MNAKKRVIALMEFLLLLPAALFMASLVLRQLKASGLDAAAQRMVMWYAQRQWTLWLLLVTFPLVVVVTACATLSQSSYDKHPRTSLRKPLTELFADGSSIFIAAIAFVAAIILALVGLHILAN